MVDVSAPPAAAPHDVVEFARHRVRTASVARGGAILGRGFR